MTPIVPPVEAANAVRRKTRLLGRATFLRPLGIAITVCLLLVISFLIQLALPNQNGSIALFCWLLGLGLLAGAVLAFGPNWPLGPLPWQDTPVVAGVPRPFFAMAGVALFLSLFAAWLVGTNGSATVATVAWVVALLLVLVAAAGPGAPARLRALPFRCLAAVRRPENEWYMFALLAIVLVAAALRLPALDAIPGYIHNDEASNGLQARMIADGQVSSLFSNGWYHLPMLGYAWDALFFRVLGDSLVSLRLSSAVLGIASILIVALLGGELFNRRAGLLAAALLTLFHIDIHFSRVGHHYIQALFAVTLTLYLLVRCLRHGSRLAAVGAGIFLSVDIQVYYAGRVAYAIVPLVIAYVLLVSDRALLRSRLPLLGWLALGWVVGIAPIGAVILGDWGSFMSRTDDVLVLGQSAPGHVFSAYGTLDPFYILRTQLWRVLQTFNYAGDSSVQYGIQHPMLDPVSAALFPAATAYAIFRMRRAGYAICVAALVLVVIIGGVLTIDPPFWPRLIVLAPLLALVLGAFLDALWGVLGRIPHVAIPSFIAAIALVVTIGKGNYDWYFNEFEPQVHASFLAAPMDLGNYLRPIADHPYVYGITDGGLYVDHQAVQLLVPDLRSCDVLQGLELSQCQGTPGNDVIFVVMPGRMSLRPELERRYPGGIEHVLRTYDSGAQILIYRIQRGLR